MFNFDIPVTWYSVTICGLGDVEVYYGVTFDPDQSTIISAISVGDHTVLRNITTY